VKVNETEYLFGDSTHSVAQFVSQLTPGTCYFVILGFVAIYSFSLWVKRIVFKQSSDDALFNEDAIDEEGSSKTKRVIL